MNCPICGAPIADGAAFCNNCGSPVAQQPQQGIQYQQPNQQYQQPNQQYQQPGPQYQQQPGPQYQQPGPQYQQPDPMNQQPGQMYQNFPQNQKATLTGGGIISTITKDPFLICTFVGFFFLFISSWFPRWVRASGVGGAGLFASDGGILKLYAFLFLAIVGWGVVVYLNVVPEVVEKYRKLPFSQFYLPALALIVWILCMTNSNFRMIVNAGKAYSLLGGSAGYGFIAWLCLIGILLLLVRPVMKIVKKEEFWDF